MGKIFCIFGKSGSGKDSLYQKLMERNIPGLKFVIPYTTRPIKENEVEGREYHFVSKEDFVAMLDKGEILEYRKYDTVYGDWYYFTSKAGIDLTKHNYVLIGTPESVKNLRQKFSNEEIEGLYIHVDDAERLQRALDREKLSEKPRYKEMCRRFLSDSEDFSEEKMAEIRPYKEFINDNIERLTEETVKYIEMKIDK